MCDDFAKFMHDEFEMSMMGELNFFLGLQIKQMKDDIFFNQSKYIKEMLKKFSLEDSKPMKTPMSSDDKLTKDEEYESVDNTKYRGTIGSLLYITEIRPDDAVVVRDFYKKVYNSIGRVPNRCSSSIGKTQGLLSFFKRIGWEGLITV
uniref:Retrovirus-related Pol polyprotein from transposon TNT 1-94 n=1 Tax=Tanacetum cinerariifolium TaxID=118510 RepID=A0A699I1Z4_TANCI|nr:retrovirus-related Pol polyprotein from transposon TNT 1-94 [Tanacetum cinerariifolium]